MMKNVSPPQKKAFSLLDRDGRLVALIAATDQRTLALWAIDCAERVMHHFEDHHRRDKRPRRALSALARWIETGVFSMKTIRAASLGAHAAAREVGRDSAARSAARAAGQAVGTAHVAAHCIGAAMYALQAIHRDADASDVDPRINAERRWQLRQLKARRREVDSPPQRFTPQTLGLESFTRLARRPRARIIAHFNASPGDAKALVRQCEDKRYAPSTFIEKIGNRYRTGWLEVTDAGVKLSRVKVFPTIAQAAAEYLILSFGRTAF